MLMLHPIFKPNQHYSCAIMPIYSMTVLLCDDPCSKFTEEHRLIHFYKNYDTIITFFCSIVSQPTQPWHDQVYPDLRQHLVKKL
jgi:hypothetical protein